MNFLVLGRGKTGSLVAQYAAERHHKVHVLAAEENKNAKALTPDLLHTVNVVIDFTTPAAVLENIEACLREKINMVVGTTGWHTQLGGVRARVEKAGIGFLRGPNFSIGVNLVFETARAAAHAASHGYSG